MEVNIELVLNEYIQKLNETQKEMILFKVATQERDNKIIYLENKIKEIEKENIILKESQI